MNTDLDALRTELDGLNTQRDIAKARVDIQDLTRLAETGSVVMEAYGEPIDPLEYLHDDPAFGGYTAPISRRDDRQDGRYRPVYKTEQELSFIRGAVHVLTTSFGSAINILENLTNYTIAGGFKHVVKGQHEKLVKKAQYVLDTFFDDNSCSVL